MKRKYLSPCIRTMQLGSALMTVPSSLAVNSAKEATGDNGGWSREFWGLVDDDDASSQSDTPTFPADN